MSNKSKMLYIGYMYSANRVVCKLIYAFVYADVEITLVYYWIYVNSNGVGGSLIGLRM